MRPSGPPWSGRSTRSMPAGSGWPGRIRAQAGDFRYNDRIPLTSRLEGVRAVPGSIVRWGAHVAPGCVLMPSFVNIGAYVDAGTMVDTWATVGSCAQIGKNVHLA